MDWFTAIHDQYLMAAPFHLSEQSATIRWSCGVNVDQRGATTYNRKFIIKA